MPTRDFRDHFAEVDPEVKSRRRDLWARFRFAPPLASIAPFGTSPRNVRYLQIVLKNPSADEGGYRLQ
jgi:hypothetical protein